MRIDILTLFPGMFSGPLSESILRRAIRAGLLSVALHDIRDYAADRHRTVDDTPFGGGAGMVMKPGPLAAAIRAVVGGEADQSPRTKADGASPEAHAAPPPDATDVAPGTDSPSPFVLRPSSNTPPVILLSPDGEPFTQRMAEALAREPRLVLVCGHYEGVDERVREALVTREVSIGDYVLTGGELAAMVITDAVARLVPGVIDHESAADESHSGGLLEYPHYTRPAEWEGRAVPPVLLSGHHGEVAKWRRRERLRRTLARRPDLLAGAELSDSDRQYLRSLGWRSHE